MKSTKERIRADSSSYSLRLPWIHFVSGVLYVVLLGAVARYLLPATPPTAWLVALTMLAAGSLIASLPYSSIALFLDMTIISLLWLFFERNGFGNGSFCFLPLAAAVLISVSYPVAPRSSPIIASLLTVAWFVLAGGASGIPNATQWCYATAAALMLIVFTASILLQPRKRFSQIDMLLCSYSSNTAHFAGLFADAANKAGADVSVHRFHHYHGFTARYDGDAFVVAFPVFGCKPPWPLLYYLIRELPRGCGKPAFILYTAAGGAENAGTLVWLLLTLKGYRVAGRNWGVYPLNVPTIRIGPRKFWLWLDSLTPFGSSIRGIEDAGKLFVEGKPAGLPIIFWPFILWIAGVVTDNSIIDRIYRNHAFRKRCNGCGICVSYCPAERLRMVNRRPKAQGTCALCLGCVNTCPTNAMQMWFFTEYGKPYRPKWPSLLVRNKS